MKSAEKKPDPHHSWMPPKWEPADAGAIQALAAGKASEHQQKRALKWIIEQCAATYELSFDPSNSRATDFAEGRRFVGLQLVKLLHINLGAFAKRDGD